MFAVDKRGTRINRPAPVTAIFIAHDYQNEGAIEGMCWKPVESEPVALWLDDYVDYLTTYYSLKPNNMSKSSVHAFLASQ